VRIITPTEIQTAIDTLVLYRLWGETLGWDYLLERTSSDDWPEEVRKQVERAQDEGSNEVEVLKARVDRLLRRQL
jgi:hypothetical protein